MTLPLARSASIVSLESVLSVDEVRKSKGMFVPRENIDSVTITVCLCALLLESPICQGPGRCVPPDTHDARQIRYCNDYLFCGHELFKARTTLSHFCVLCAQHLFTIN